MIDGFPIFIAMGLRRARSLSQLKKIPWVTYLKTSSPWDNIHVLTRQNWQIVDQSSWITIKKFYYKVRYEIFYESATAYFITKCNGLSNWLQTATTFFFVLLQSTTGLITLRQGLQNVTIIPRATVRAFLHRPSPPLSLKACRDWMQRRKSFSFKFVCAYLV